MDAIGTLPNAVQTLPAPTSNAASALPKPVAHDAPPVVTTDQATIDAQVQKAEQKRYEAVQRMAQDVANVYVVSDKRFTIFKDVTGQYITRFTSLRDGRVTYIPQPKLVALSGNNAGPTVAIKV